MLTVSLIEDDCAFCELVSHSIRLSGKLRLLSSYSTAEETLKHVPQQKPDVVLVDIKLPGIDGIECVRRFRAMTPELLIHFMILTHHEDDDLVFEALKAGAHGYLLKDYTASERLITAINEVVNGGAPMTPRIARKVTKHFERRSRPIKSLSAREEEVLQRLARGLAYKEIAGELSISVNTVRKHLGSIYNKLQVNSGTAAAMQYANQQGI